MFLPIIIIRKNNLMYLTSKRGVGLAQLYTLGNMMTLTKTSQAVLLALATSSASLLAYADETETVESIVITGQKFDRSLQETPSSVGVATQDDLEALNVQDVADLFSSMPNVSGHLGQGFNIRGINAFNVSGGGNSFLTSMYLDGAPIPYRLMRLGGLSVWDLSQIEVFRGPQSTLQGRNSLAGAVVIKTQEPTYEWNGKAKVTLGQRGQEEFAFAGGGALIDDLLAFRVSAEDKKQDGANYNTTRQDNPDYQDSQTVRAKLLFEPTQNFSALLSASSNKSELGARWVLYNEGEDPFERAVDFNSHIWQKTETDIFNLELSWALNDELTLNSVTTYNDSDYGYNWDGDLTPQQLTRDTRYQRRDKTKSQELRLSFDYEWLQGVVGLYASDLDVEDSSLGERSMPFVEIGLPPLQALLVAPAAQGGLGLSPTVANMIVPLYPNIDPVKLGLNTDSEQAVQSKALFADAKVSVSDVVELLFGFRYDRETQENSSNSLYTINNTLPDQTQVAAPLQPIVAGINSKLNGLAARASGSEPLTKDDFTAFLPKLGVSVHLTDEITTSFIYQKGYRSGGVGMNSARATIYTYEPEYTDNYELSLRSVWLDGELVVNANVFYLDWKDQQVQKQLSSAQFDVVTLNAGESRVKGLETELFYYPSKQLSITAGVGYASTEFTEFTNKSVDLSGRSFADAPEWTANMAANYEFESGLFAKVNANYTGSSYAYIEPEKELGGNWSDQGPKNDARLLFNAQFGYEWQNYLIRLDVQNLLDEEYIPTYFRDPDSNRDKKPYGQHILGNPRQISLSIQAEF